MLLIADSGSTKTDWRLNNDEETTIKAFQSQGINPYFLTEKEIALSIQKEVIPFIQEVKKVIFYGAGCGLPKKAQEVKSALLSVLPDLLSAEVYSDILGAARSLLQNQPGIACILGTGANSCIYNGLDIINNVPSLGYVFADWGSGTVLSKDLISLILQEKISKSIRDDFYSTYQMDRRQILDRIYNKPMANTFLASFTPFLLKHAENSFCKEIILHNFRQFFDYYVLQYPQYQPTMKVSFAGSIAYYFREYLKIAAEELDISIGSIVKNPMEGLVKYHIQTVLKQ